ncbi:MAG: radical SAM protein [Candidatus Micrarchaeota archaeon]|nr:radical SAM protein [Candidatus Micrarchaeota archaeon]
MGSTSACTFPAAEAGASKARRATVDITDFCPNRCIICSRTDAKPLMRMLGFPAFEKIIRSHPSLESAAMEGGEPWCNPDIVKMINLCFARGIMADISTSATVWREDVVQALAANGGKWRLQVHIPSADAAGYEKFTGNNAWDAVLANVQHLAERLGRESLWLRTTICAENLGGLKGIVELSEKLGLKLGIAPYIPVGGGNATVLAPGKIDSVLVYAAAYGADFFGAKGKFTGCPVLSASYGITLQQGGCPGLNGTSIHYDAGGNARTCEYMRGN